MVEIRNLTAGYGDTPVLRDVSLTFPQGQLTAIIGPNGCGKSTLLRSLIGLTPQVSGEILVDGQNAAGLSSTRLAQKIAYLPQMKRVPDMTVEQLVLHGRFPYLSYPRRYRAGDREKAAQAMAALGIGHLAREKLTRLSGGTQQKCYIAMALAQDSATILMDEPTSYLDISYQLQLMALASDLAGQGKAMVLVLHDLDLALRCAGQVILMERGVIRMAGTASEIYESSLIDQVFGVRTCRYATPFGEQYCFIRKE